MRVVLFVLLAASLAGQNVPTPAGAQADPAILLIRVLEGAGAIHKTGSRVASALVIEVTDDTGKPVQGALVSFRLPPDGPSGTFPNGITTDVVIAGSDGRAAASGVRWNKSSGPFDFRVTVAKGPARAGTTVSQRLSDSPEAAKSHPEYYHNRSRLKVVLIVAAAAAGSAVAGLALGKRSQPKTETSGSVSLGTPTITIGNP